MGIGKKSWEWEGIGMKKYYPSTFALLMQPVATNVAKYSMDMCLSVSVFDYHRDKQLCTTSSSRTN